MEFPSAYDPSAIGQALSEQHNHKKLRSLFMQAPAAIALLEGPQHIYTFANPLYQKIFNRTEEQLIGKTPKQVFPEVEGQGIYELFEKVYHTQEPFMAAEFPATFQDGGALKTGYYNFAIQPIRNESGNATDLMVHVYEVTGQVEARKKTEESEARYRSLFNNLDEGFCVIEILLDAAGQPADYLFLEVNDVFEAQTGLKNAPGKTARALVPGLEEHWIQIYGNVALTGEPAKLTEGSEAMGRWFEINAFRFGDRESRRVAILFRDVTEKRTAERVLQENKELLQTVFDASPNSLTVYEPVHDAQGNIEDFRFIMANEFTVRTTGRTDLPGKRYAETFPNVKESGVLEAFIKVAATGVPADFEKWYGGEGLRHWFRFIVNKVGNLLVVTTEDITTRKRSEEGLRESEQYFRQLADTVPAIIWLTRPDGSCIYLNRNWYEYTGQTVGEAEGFGWLQATHPDDAAEAGRLFLEATEKQAPYYILYRLRHRSGEYRWAIDSGRPKFSEDGTFEGMIGTVIDVHEQKLAEDKIRESEMRFRSMADASPVMIWTLDENGNSTYYNNMAREFTGHSENELKEGKSWQVAIHPDDIEFAASVVRNAVAHRIPYQMECRMQRADGEWRWVLSHGTPRFGSEGQYFGFVGSSIDITERKIAESGLAQSESRFRSIFQTAGVSIWEEDFSAVKEALDGLKAEGVTDFRSYLAHHPEFVERCMGLVRVTDVNDATLEMLEAEHKEQIVLSEVFLPETMPVFVGELIALAEGQISFESECRIKTLKGNLLYVLFTMKLAGSGDSYNRVLFTLLDITERKAAEEKVRASEERFRVLAEAFPHLAWTASPEGKGTYFNRRWYEYTGLLEEEALRDDGRRTLHPDDWQRAAGLWQQHLQSGEPVETELRYREGSTGLFRWFLIKVVPVKNENGQILMWIGTCTDIHEQKRTLESLESLVSERTKELQRSNDDLQQFAHVASHDLKEPVRKIKTFTGRLEEHFEGTLDATAARYFEKIHVATDRMFTMIEGVLAYSTINASSQTPQPVDLNEVMKNIETDLEVVIQRTGTQIHYSRLPVIEGASVLLYQLFYNLVNNSIKFAKADTPPRILISAETATDDGVQWAKLTLSDNGIGFEAAQATAIFDTFTRLNSKDKYEGTGLGLALCKKIVERHNGSISATGALGTGAAFTIQLPIHQNKRSI
ncbi:MAG TPA: PAS domain S-box protein [Chitinophagaceae bacterium]|jgi:hypothetical protein|nr:PAS domain S-box protein [Chitinophagaceae bacterium]